MPATPSHPPRIGNTYRFPIVGVTTIADCTWELALASSAAVRALVAYRLFGNSAYYLTICRRSSAFTGGTSAAMTAAKVDSNSPSATLTGKQFSVAQTGGGVLVATLGRVLVTNTIQLPPDPLPWASPLVLNPGEWLTLDASGAVASSGYLEWVEIPT